VSILDAIKSHGRHRGKTPAQLRTELDEADCKLIELATEIDQLKAARNQLQEQLDTAGIDLSGALEDLRAAEQSIRHLDAVVLLRDMEIDKLNERIRVGIGAEHVIAKTQEIDTRELQDRFTEGPVVSLHHAPQADPGQTAWGAAREAADTEPVPVVDLPQQREAS